MESLHRLSINDDDGAGPANLDLIEDNLWLGKLNNFYAYCGGNWSAATDIISIEKHKILSIVTVETCPLPRNIAEINEMKTLFIQVTDTPREDLLSHFEDAYKFISQAVERGGVLVHCYHGVSRSSTIVIAYLMKRHAFSLSEAMEYAKSRRRFVHPNAGFLAQLRLYEAMGAKIEASNLQYRMFRLYITADQVKKVKIIPQGCKDVLKSDPDLVRADPDPRGYRCRKCRRIVALVSNILPHAPGSKYSWKHSVWNHPIRDSDMCSLTLFVEPMSWMPGVASSEEGRLQCPKCQSKLGSFSWTMGCQCPCGTRVSPAFYLVPSKVDKSNFLQNVQVTV